MAERFIYASTAMRCLLTEGWVSKIHKHNRQHHRYGYQQENALPEALPPFIWGIGEKKLAPFHNHKLIVTVTTCKHVCQTVFFWLNFAFIHPIA
jgi:hypothetical protein